MPHQRTRRAARLGATAAAAALTALSFTSVPAQAATGDNLFSFTAPDPQTILPLSAAPQGTVFRTITPTVTGEGEDLTGVTVAVNAASLAGIAELRLPSQCSFTDAAHLHASCSLGSVGLLSMGSFDLGLRAVAGAAAGAHGSIRFTTTAANATEDTSLGADDSTPVTIGDGADLAVGQLTALKVKPGGSTGVQPQVSNLGDRDSDGVVMYVAPESLGNPGDFAVGGNYSNCDYGVGDKGDPSEDDNGVLCRFDSTVVKPGDVLVPSAPLPVSAAATATQGVVAYGFDVSGGPLDKQTTKGHPGTGAPLTLVPVPVQPRTPSNVDIDYDNNVGYTDISTGLVDDVAAVGADVHGTVGRSLSLTAGVRNSGNVPTAPMPGAPSPRDTAVVVVMLPDGLTVTRVPQGCQSLDPDGGGDLALPKRVRSALAATPPPVSTASPTAPPSAAQGGAPGAVYGCFVDRVLQPGQSGLFTFTVKPTKVLDAAQGEVFAGGPLDDADPEDDMASLTVSAVAAPATAATPTAAPATTAPATVPTGGGLADTGGGDDSLPLAGVGAAAVLLGTLAVVFAARRRRAAGRD